MAKSVSYKPGHDDEASWKGLTMLLSFIFTLIAQYIQLADIRHARHTRSLISQVRTLSSGSNMKLYSP